MDIMQASDLKAWRKARGITQAQAAQLLNAVLITYQTWEQGISRVPGPVAKLCDVLDRIERK